MSTQKKKKKALGTKEKQSKITIKNKFKNFHLRLDDVVE